MTDFDDRTMRAVLLENGAKRRITATGDYWYILGRAFGVPIGIAYSDMLDELRRRERRAVEIDFLKANGMKYLKGAGWFDPSTEVAVFLFHVQAMAYIKSKENP